MHILLSSADRIERLRRRVDAAAAWIVAAERPVGDWTFDGLPIAMGDVWPDLEGEHRFHCPAFEVPADWDLDATRLELDMGGESLLVIRFASGSLFQAGLDPFHQSFPLAERRGALDAHSVARGLLGQPSPDPRLRKARLVRLHPALDELVKLLRLLGDTAEALGDHDAVSSLLFIGEDALAALDFPTATPAVLSRSADMSFLYNGRPAPRIEYGGPLGEGALESVSRSLAGLRSALRLVRERHPPQGRIALIGHAHIDAAWLWTLDETRRKVRRSFSTAVNLLDANPDFRFTQSFAEYYHYLESDDPALFARIEAHAAAGRWEPAGGLWVEPDVVMPTGESLARQALYGQHYFKRTFGRYHRVAWLPDTFGFSPALPQIFRLSGIDAMFTVKLGWSETNRFPHGHFRWEGIDGSQVRVTHFVARETGFNGAVEPARLLRVWRNHPDKHFVPEALYPIGHGDGGGGPTEEMIGNRERLALFPVVPELRFATAQAFFEDMPEDGVADVWSGELYLEFHRGVLTSQGRTKRLHRLAEHNLVATEALGCAAYMLGGERPEPLDALWRTLMVNQFHDILPGSSIADVHDQAERELAGIAARAGELIDQVVDSIADRIITPGPSDGLLVVNPAAGEVPLRVWSAQDLPGGQVVETGSVFTSTCRAMGFGASIVPPDRPMSGVCATTDSLENGLMRIEFAADGTIARFYDKLHDRAVIAGRANEIRAYRDQPRFFDAWDIEEDYARSWVSADLIEPPTVVETGPHRAAVRIERMVASTRIVQIVRLWANSPRLEFDTTIDCADRQLLLKAIFPLAVRSDHASYECAFGLLKRPTHRNTSWDAARFEVAGHRFADLSEPGYGVALLNDGRYGHHAHASELGLTLLRSPIAPAPLADEGRHHFSYALFPHPGDLGAVVAEAANFNRPMIARPVRTADFHVTPFARCAGVSMAVSALKPAEDGHGLILRAYEPIGARGPISLELPRGWAIADEVNLLEEPLAVDRDDVKPFEIRSWRIARTASQGSQEGEIT